MIAELSDKAKLSKVPKLIVSKGERLASTRVFLNQIIVGEYMLSQWQEGAFSENDVYASLAHEIGHRMDFSRNIRSVNFRYSSMRLSYVAIGLALVWLVLLPQLPNSWVLSLAVFAVWVAFLPWIIIRTGVPVELEADKNAVGCLIRADQLANSVVKKSRLAPAENLGLIGTLEFLYNVLSHPSLKERLHNLNFEIKQIEIQKIDKDR
jgi:predicted Zn-dependent protease